jgi:hypothetical protein
MKIYRQGDFLISELGGKTRYLPWGKIELIDHGDGTVTSLLDLMSGSNIHERIDISTATDKDGNPYGTTIQDFALGISAGTDVNMSDQDTPAIIAPFSQIHHATTTTVETVKEGRTLQVANTGTIAVGDIVSIFHLPSKRYYIGHCLSFTATSILLDTPFDFEYPIGSFVDIGDDNLAVDGSVTPQIFGLRNSSGEAPVGIDFTADIVRFVFSCETASSVDLSKFGDIAGGLTNGLVMRKVDGTYQNIFNVHNNAELAGLMFDWTPFSAQNANQGQDGFVARFTMGGQSKIGVVERIRLGEDLQVIVQDALQTIVSLRIMAEGHQVRY